MMRQLPIHCSRPLNYAAAEDFSLDLVLECNASPVAPFSRRLPDRRQIGRTVDIRREYRDRTNSKMAPVDSLPRGDLSVVHLVLPSDLIQTAAEEDLGVILRLLRPDDYSGLQNGGVVNVAGAQEGSTMPTTTTRFTNEKAPHDGTVLEDVLIGEH